MPRLCLLLFCVTHFIKYNTNRNSYYFICEILSGIIKHDQSITSSCLSNIKDASSETLILKGGWNLDWWSWSRRWRMPQSDHQCIAGLTERDSQPHNHTLLYPHICTESPLNLTLECRRKPESPKAPGDLDCWAFLLTTAPIKYQWQINMYFVEDFIIVILDILYMDKLISPSSSADITLSGIHYSFVIYFE